MGKMPALLLACLLSLCAAACDTQLNPLSIFDRDYTRQTSFDKYGAMELEELKAHKAEILQLADSNPKDALYSTAFYRVAGLQDVQKALAASGPLERQRLHSEQYHRSGFGLHSSRGSYMETSYQNALATALWTAVTPEVALLLLQAGQVVESYHLQMAVDRYSDLNTFKTMLPYTGNEAREGALYHNGDDFENPNWAEAVAELVRQGVKLQNTNSLYHPPLVNHAGNGNLNAVKILLDNGADVDAMSVQYRCTALWEAERSNHYGRNNKVLLLLLERGADPTVPGNGNLMEKNLLKYYMEQHGNIDFYADWNGQIFLKEHFNPEVFRAMLAAYPKGSPYVKEVYGLLKERGLHPTSNCQEIMQYFK